MQGSTYRCITIRHAAIASVGPSELVATTVLPTGGAIARTCIRLDGCPDAVARHRKLDAVRVDGLTTTG